MAGRRHQVPKVATLAIRNNGDGCVARRGGPGTRVEDGAPRAPSSRTKNEGEMDKDMLITRLEIGPADGFRGRAQQDEILHGTRDCGPIMGVSFRTMGIDGVEGFPTPVFSRLLRKRDLEGSKVSAVGCWNWNQSSEKTEGEDRNAE